MNKKNLYRSQGNNVIAGVFGGIGEYFDIDPVWLRLSWVLVTVFTGFAPGIIIYIFAMFIVPKRVFVEGEYTKKQ
ncbi:PspC domain-containing protein [Patescibacteria group bacterium]